MKNLLLILTLFILLTSCNTAKQANQQQDNTNDICESMSFNTNPVEKISTNYYSIDSLFIHNSCLNIWVSYSGGCGDAEFNMYYTDKMIETIPPVTKLRLQLIDDDPCRAIVQQKLFYNLSFFDEYADKDGILLELVGSEKNVLFKK